jgi:exopolysaccharide biosynthesis polyprenyl glycosylphosphotransferase
VLIYGVGTAARELAQVLTQDPGARMSVRGFVNPAGAGSTPATLLGKPVLARHEHLAATTGPSGAQTVLMPLALFDTAGIEAATRQLAPFPVALKLVPNMAVRGIPLQFVDHSAPVPMLQICASQPSVLVRMVKRAEDLVLAPLLLLAAAPLLLLAAVAVRLDSPGPVLFRQARRGADGVVFQVYKFRTMYHMAADQHGKVQAVQGDARVTRVGAVLRRTSLDEMPQLLNVLLGSMSLVGPRPHALGSCAGGIPFEQAVAAYPARQRVRPGITGWAQVNGWRGETDTVDKLTGRVTHDLWYIANWSLGLDLMIMLRTVAAIMSGRNAY